MMATNGRTRLGPSARHGTAAVECAIVTPLLILVVLGAIDMGQYANAYQKVSDASREGARIAARNTTQNTSEVQAAVMDYLARVSPGVSPATLASATQVSVTDSAGNSVPGGALSGISSGSQLRVQVTLQFDPIRWIGGVSSLDGSQIAATAIMRRE